jgi:tRNA G10  N-methylase Trm11
MIKSIGYNQQEIIRDILALHNGGRNIECDPTFSRGIFYKGLNRPRLTFDLVPQDELTIQADCRNLPLGDESVESIMFDPPFVISKGPSLLLSKEGQNKIHSRFSSFENVVQLGRMYWESLVEFRRILKRRGILIFKCQDTVSGGINIMSHCEVWKMAQELEFYPKDLFILLSKGRMNSGKWKTQRHGRKHHSYFWVFIKK